MNSSSPSASHQAPILVVEDEANIAGLLRGYLEAAGYRVSHASNGHDALHFARREDPRLIVLDLMLPGLDGLRVCEEIRRESEVPILMLTARAAEEDKLAGLGCGADDYVTKPFNPREVVARVGALLRRSERTLRPDERLRLGPFRLDPVERVASLRNDALPLTPTEFDLLETLMRRPRAVHTRRQLLDACSTQPTPESERVVDVHVANLRKKIEPDASRPRYLLTVRGLGYKLVEGE
jgi:two-component system alkaline phosphatase synthesis response regulator PhoP